MSGSDRVAVVTVVSKNYLALARTLAASVREHEPGARMFVLLVDELEGRIDPAREAFELVGLSELDNIPAPRELCFKYNVLELNTAVKPYLFEHLFRKHGLTKLVYLDPDILLLDSLSEILGILDGHSLVVTPHITSPIEDDRRPNELDLLRAGTFNLGFLGMADTPTTGRFLAWWQRRLYDYCAMDPDIGMHVDQNWINLVPAMFGDTVSLDDRRYNVAYWNLHERAHRITHKDGRFELDGRPLGFFHFSGFNAEQIEPISKHQDRFTLSDLPQLRPLFERYRDLLARNGHGEARQWPYAYGSFSNGVPIPDAARRLYRQLGPVARRFGNPFAADGEESFFSWLNERVVPIEPQSGDVPMTRIVAAVYESHAWLQSRFPDPLGRHRGELLQHLTDAGAEAYGLSPVFLEAMRGPGGSVGGVGQQSRRAAGVLRRRLKAPVRALLGRDTAVGRLVRSLDRRIQPMLSSWPELPERRTRRAPALPYGVNVAGYVTGGFGVAEAARCSVKALRAAGVPHVVSSVRAEGYADLDTSVGGVSDDAPYRVNLVHVNADQVEQFVRDRGWDHLRGRRNVGYWYWELARFPERWRESFRYFDEIWVATSFVQDAIAQGSPLPVVKLTPPVMLDLGEARADRVAHGLPDDAFVFLFTFDFLSVFERKNPLGLVEAFRRAFGTSSEALLVLKSLNADKAPDAVAALRGAANGLNVRFIDTDLDRPAMFGLIAASDAFASLHRSEGFGMGLAQAMFLGKPVIGTAYSGNLEFMTPQNSFLVGCDVVELACDYGPYERGNVWAEPDLDHAAELLRQVRRDPALASLRGARGAADLRRWLDPAVVGRRMDARLRRISEP